MGGLAVGKNGIDIQSFMPTSGKTISGTYSPSENETVKFATAVDITIGSSLVPYVAGDIITLNVDTSYIFSVSTVVHVM